MTLTNNNLMIMSQFAIRAKKHIGLVKSVDMFQDRQYASQILIKAALSESEDLMQLSKKISLEFNFDSLLMESLESCIQHLKAKNADKHFIQGNKEMLIRLSRHLYGIKVDGDSYRLAVDKLLLDCEAHQKTACITLAREFYRFWREAYKTPAELSRDKERQLNANKEQLLKLWHNVDAEFFSDVENWPLGLYTEYMIKKGVSEEEIKIKQKIAKLIAVKLRSYVNQEEENYRTIVCAIKEALMDHALTDVFVTVAREYHHFRLGSASNMNMG